MKASYITPTITAIEDFMTESECQQYIELSERIGYEAAKIDTGKVVTEVRNNERAFYEDKALADDLFARAKPYLTQKIGNSVAVGLNEMFRFYRYEKGHRFKGHQDGSFIRNHKEASYFTFMVYLNEGCVGGETSFMEHKITPKQGMALVFLHRLYHEGSEVLEGVKYVLRTDVMYQLQENNG